MNYLANFKVNDLICDDGDVTFILESPHTEEVKAGFPAAGESGKCMSKVLFGSDVSLGKLVSDNLIPEKKLSIINCLSFPLQSNCNCYNPLELNDEEYDFLEIKNIPFIDIGLFKRDIKEKIRTKVGLKYLDNFKGRLLDHLSGSSDLKIIVCGSIAQCFFEEATGSEGIFRKSVDVNWQGNSFSVFYEYHPSPKSGQWKNSFNMVDLLEFIN